jgi:hypothetical protein
MPTQKRRARFPQALRRKSVAHSAIRIGTVAFG